MTNISQLKGYYLLSFTVKVALFHIFAILAFVVLLPGLAAAGNLAPLGTGILGFNSAANEGPGTQLFHAGIAGAINDENTTTSVDNYSGGSDGGQGFSFVGVVWSSTRYEEIQSLTLTLAAFLDGGWFGPNGSGPGAGGLLTPDYLTEPVVQVSTNGGASWITTASTSDYLTMLNGAGIGGGDFPNPNPLSATFTLNPVVTNVDGIRIIGSNGGTADGNGFIGVFELAIEGTLTDTDLDGMPDGWEQANGLSVGTNDSAGDLDSDALANLQEYLTGTDPKNPDTDGDGFGDGFEVAQGSSATDSSSIPGNLARQGTAMLGTQDSTGFDSEVYNAGVAANINDGDLTTRVDTWNAAGVDTLSFVGIVWTSPVATPVATLRLSLATFFDGGWFGVNSAGPGAGGLLSTNEYLIEPMVQASGDGGLTWTNVAFVSDYMTSLEGHALPAVAFGSPTLATANFQLNPPAAGITGIRLLGTEGGTASGGFLGVFELAAFGSSPELQVLRLENATFSGGEFSFEFDSQAGVNHVVQFKADVNEATWQTRSTIVGDGTRKQFSEAVSGGQGFYRIANQ